MTKIICINCEKEFHVTPNRRKSAKFCSSKCCGESIRGKPTWNKGTGKLIICKGCGIKFQAPNGIKNLYCNRACWIKNHVVWNKGKKYLGGDKHWNWKGGITSINKIIRESLEYKQWRKKVFERDDYTCINCNVKGGKLNADHIKPFAYFPELRFNVNNGRTLCVECHRMYGWKSRKNQHVDYNLQTTIQSIHGAEL